MGRSLERQIMARIGICGTHSTGKTTLLSALRSEKVFKDYAICDEVTRTIKAMGIPINENGNDTTQKLVMNQHVVNLALHENMITDRTTIDGMVYTRWLYDQGNLSVDTLEYADFVTKKIVGMYDVIFWLVPEFDIVADGVRSTNTDFRSQVHTKFADILCSKGKIRDEYKDRVFKLTGSVRERVDQVLKACKEKGIIGEY